MAKQYAINIENDQVISVAVDGVSYNDPDQIPDPDDRAKVRQLLAASNHANPDLLSLGVSNHFDDDFRKDFEPHLDEPFRELERQSAQLPNVITGVFLAVSLPLLAIATFLTMHTLRSLDNEQSAPGRVIDLIPRQSQPGKSVFYYPVVEFSLPNKHVQTVELTEGSRPPAYDKGDTVTVLYDPAQPRTARIDSISSTILMWIGPAITGTVGIAFLIAALLVQRLLKPITRHS